VCALLLAVDFLGLQEAQKISSLLRRTLDHFCMPLSIPLLTMNPDSLCPITILLGDIFDLVCP